MRNILLSLAVVMSLQCSAAAPPADGDWLVYVGTYTRAPSVGIYVGRFSKTGKITPIGVAAETPNPTFLTVHPNHKVLYAANEISLYEGQPAGSASAFSIDPASGKLTLLDKVSTKGPGPCHVSVDKSAKWLYVANYGGGSVASLPIKSDGSLSEAAAFFQHEGSSANPRRQAGPHAHEATVSPDNHFVLVADLGLDKILAYRIDPAKGGLTPNDPPFTTVAPGSGPRHVVFSGNGKYVYAVNEMLSTVTAFHYDAAHGTLAEMQTLSTLPQGYTRNNSTAEIAVHPNGQFLYASNRGDDSIAVFRIDAASGKLTALDRVPTKGKTPRNFAIDPSGSFLLAANQDSASVVVFKIDTKTGALTPTGDTWEVPSPVSIVFVKAR